MVRLPGQVADGDSMLYRLEGASDGASRMSKFGLRCCACLAQWLEVAFVLCSQRGASGASLDSAGLGGLGLRYLRGLGAVVQRFHEWDLRCCKYALGLKP